MYLGASGAGVVVLSEESGPWRRDVECISVANDGSAAFAACSVARRRPGCYQDGAG